jgi:hypothetical protein
MPGAAESDFQMKPMLSLMEIKIFTALTASP